MVTGYRQICSISLSGRTRRHDLISSILARIVYLKCLERYSFPNSNHKATMLLFDGRNDQLVRGEALTDTFPKRRQNF